MTTTQDLNGIAAALARKGYRLTSERRAVVRAILSGEDVFSVADIVQLVPETGRATVFRAVKLLVDLGLVCRLRLDGGSVRYRLSRAAHHHHLVCTGCGSVEDFADCDVAAISQSVAMRTDYEIQGHRLELYGLCPTCRSEAKVRS
jgi:Fur family ferric uptake transcriptional regulator